MLKITLFSFLSFAIGFYIARNLYFNPIKHTLPQSLNESGTVNSPKVDNPQTIDNLSQNMVEKKDAHTNDKNQKKNKKKFRDDKASKLEIILIEGSEKGEVQSYVKSSNGDIWTKEKISNGRLVHRLYNQANLLISESSEDGAISKSFYENGQIKAIKAKFADGEIVNILKDVSGNILVRKDELPNGDEIAWEFNEYGELIYKWLIRKNQKPVQLNL